MYQEFDSWDPRKDDYEDRNFNSYAITGPARYLVGTRTHGNSRQVNTSLYVTGIPLALTQTGLLNLFSRSGRVVSVKILPGKSNKRDTIGFVKMESIGDAERAIRDMNNFQLEGFRFKVKMARSDDDKARLREEQLGMQSYYFNENDDSDLEENFSNQPYNLNENQPQPVTNGYGDYPGYKPKGRGRGEMLSELTGLYGKFRSLPMQNWPNMYAGPSRSGLGPGGDNRLHGGTWRKQGLLPTPPGASRAANGPVENLSITIDHDNHRNLSRMNETITLESLNRGGRGQRFAGRGSMFDQYNSSGNFHMTSRGQGRGHSFHQRQPQPDIYSLYGIGSGGYGRGASLPGSYPHKTPTYGGPQSPMTRFPQSQAGLLQTAGLLQPAVSPNVVNETFRKENKEKPKPKEKRQKECTYCGKLGASACTHCKSPYCSKDCQKADWPEHKHICKTIGRENEVAEAFESKFTVSVGDELIPEVKKLMERATGDCIEITKKERKEDPKAKYGSQSDSSDGHSRSSQGTKKPAKSNKNNKLDEKKNVKQKPSPGGYETDMGTDRRNKARNETEVAGYDTDVGRNKRGCFNCGKKGHLRLECPQPHGILSECFNCKKMGHLSKDCPQKSGKPTQTAKPKPTITETKKEEPNIAGDWDDDTDVSTTVGKESSAPLAQSTPVDVRNKGRDRSSKSPGKSVIPVAELPLNEDVAVVVTHTKSAMEIWLQDIQQTLPIQDTMVEMGNKFPKCPCDVKLNEVQIGDYYGAKYVDEAWYRVQVKQVSRQGDLQVHYIDFGNTEAAKINDLRQLDSSMMKESAKAILCAFEGVDSATSVKIDPDTIKKHVVIDKMYEARCARVLEEEGRKIFQVSFKNMEGNNVLDAVMEEIKPPSKSQLKKPIEKPSTISIKDIPHTRLEKGQKYAALFSFVVSPNLFSVQVLNLNNLSEFAEFDLKLQEFYNSKDKPHYVPTAAGEIIISKYSEDQKWYRAEVKQLYKDEVDVVFIDFGNSEKTPVESCRQIVPDFTKFERKCFQCCHHGFEIPETCPPEIISLYQHFSTNIVMIEIKDIKNDVYSVELHSTDGQSYSEEIRNLKPAEPSKLTEISSATSVPDTPPKQEIKSPVPVKEPLANIEYRQLQLNTEIEVIPIDIVSLRLFHVRLKSDEQAQQLATVMLDLNKVCTTAGPYDPVLEEFVAAQFFDGEQTLWYRGQVLEISRDGYRILYVDYGNASVVKRDAIAKLDPKFFSLPTLAIPCSLRGSEALVDNELMLNSFKNILNKVVIVKAVSCVNGIYDIEMYLEDGISLNQSLLDAATELEVENQDAIRTSRNVGLNLQKEHIQSPTVEVTQGQLGKAEAGTRLSMGDIRAVETGKMERGSRQTSLSNSLENIETSLPRMTLPAEVETPAITVHINNLASFYVQRTDEDSGMGLLHMTTELNNYCEQESTPYPCQERQLVAARFDEGSSKSWYRAQVLSLEGSTALMSFIDYGNTDRVKLSDVRELDTKFLDLPIMGIHCCLAGSDGTEPDSSVEEFKVILNHAVNLRVRGVQGDLHFVEMILKNPEKTNVNKLFGLDSSKAKCQSSTPARQVADSDPPGLENITTGHRAYVEDKSRNLDQRAPPSESLPRVDIDCEKRTFMEPPPAVLKTGTPVLGAAMHIESVSSFYIMLGDIAVQSLLGELMTDLNKECEVKSAGYTPIVGEYIAAFYLENEKDGLWYRGVVTELCDKNRFKVHYIDYGNTAIIETKHIQKLDERFLELPSFVTKCKLVDCDQLGEESSQLFKAYQDVALTIQAEREVNGIHEVQVFTQDNKNIKDLIHVEKTPNKYGSGGRSHLTASASTELVDQLPKAHTPVKDPLPKKSASPQNAERTVVFSQTITKSRPQGKEFEVVITSSVRPNLFHCHVKDDTNVVELKLLSDSMRVDCSEGSYDGISGKFEVGEMCCAKFIDGEWYRATILDVFPDNTVAVEYVDFGNRSEVNVEQLRPVRPEYTVLPLLAFKCTLHGVFPTETSWSEKAITEFKKFSDKVLFAKLMDLTSDDVYVLDLTDSDGVNIAQHLIDAGLAKKEAAEAVDDKEKIMRENELLRKQLELMQSKMAMLKMNQ